MTTLYSTGQAATQIGRSKSSVLRAAQDHKIGLVTPRGIVLTAAEIKQIAGLIKPVGCPKFKTGNKLWRKRKKAGKSRPKSR